VRHHERIAGTSETKKWGSEAGEDLLPSLLHVPVNLADCADHGRHMRSSLIIPVILGICTETQLLILLLPRSWQKIGDGTYGYSPKQHHVGHL